MGDFSKAYKVVALQIFDVKTNPTQMYVNCLLVSALIMVECYDLLKCYFSNFFKKLKYSSCIVFSTVIKVCSLFMLPI